MYTCQHKNIIFDKYNYICPNKGIKFQTKKSTYEKTRRNTLQRDKATIQPDSDMAQIWVLSDWEFAIMIINKVSNGKDRKYA